MTTTPFEIRLELLKMSKELLETEYNSEWNMIQSEWFEQVAVAKDKGLPLPQRPIIKEMFTEQDIIQKAKELNTFINYK
jgi:hypothetical protein